LFKKFDTDIIEELNFRILEALLVLGAWLGGANTIQEQTLPVREVSSAEESFVDAKKILEFRTELPLEGQYVVKTSNGTAVSPKTGQKRQNSFTKDEIKLYVIRRFLEADIEPKTIADIVTCESNWNLYAVGDSGKSIGLFQLHLPAHPSISKECAFDLECSTKQAIILAKDNKKGLRHWTCYKPKALDKDFNTPRLTP